MLEPHNHRRWRQGQGGDLQSQLCQPVEEVIACLQDAQAYAIAQGLVATPRPVLSWDERERELPIGGSVRLVVCCTTAMTRPEGRAQFDLFHDSAWTAASHQIRQALSAHRFAAAAALLERWQGQAIADEWRDYRALLDAGDRIGQDAGERLLTLEQRIVPLARSRLGPLSRDFCAPLWEALARQLQDRSYDPVQPRLHASHAWQQAAHWQGVVDSALAEPDWSTEPVLLERLARASRRLRDPEASLGYWARLCWFHPQAAEAAIDRATDDRALSAQWRRFMDAEPLLPTTDFPAWLLITGSLSRRALAPELAPASASGLAFQAAHRLMVGGGAIAERRALAALNPGLMDHYLALRAERDTR